VCYRLTMLVMIILNIYICFEKYLPDYSSFTPEFALHVSRYHIYKYMSSNTTYDLLPEAAEYAWQGLIHLSPFNVSIQ